MPGGVETILVINQRLTSEVKFLFKLIDLNEGPQMSEESAITSETVGGFQMFACNIAKKHLKIAKKPLGERF
jgi:hypothetical protein